MSLVNIAITPTRALLCVDTELQNPENGAYAEGSKFAILPHANIAVAGRGLNLMVTMVHGAATHAWPCDFKTIAESTPLFMQGAYEWIRSNHPALKRVAHEISIVGYCSHAMRMRCINFAMDLDGAVSSHELDPCDSFLSPWTEAWGEPIACDTAERMRFLGAVQVDRALEMHPEAPIGGRLLMAEITRDELKISTIAQLTVRALNQPPGPRIWEMAAVQLV